MDIVDRPILVWRAKPRAASGQRNGAPVSLRHARDCPRWVLIRDPLGQFETQALLSTDVHATPAFILDCFVQRWQMEVTFEEARAHLGVETQRQWSDKAIARTTPCLLGLYSIVTLLAQPLFATGQLSVR